MVFGAVSCLNVIDRIVCTQPYALLMIFSDACVVKTCLKSTNGCVLFEFGGFVPIAFHDFNLNVVHKSTSVTLQYNLKQPSTVKSCAALNVRGLPPATAKERNIIHILKPDLSSSALKGSVWNCAWRSVSVTVFYPHICLKWADSLKIQNH